MDGARARRESPDIVAAELLPLDSPSSLEDLNEIIPLGMHLGLDDPKLMRALETVSEHFGHWRLSAERRKGVSGRK